MTATMYPAIQKVRPEHGGLELRETARPEIGPHEVLIRVRGAAICGSDLHLYEWDESIRGKLMRSTDAFKHGLTIGHEFSGTIAALGSGVNKPGCPQYAPLAEGDYVSAESHAVCNQCYQCLLGEKHVCVNDKIIGFDRPGAFSTFIALPASCAWKNDADLPWELASVQEPLGNAMHAAAHFPLKGQSVAVFGAGPIGLFAIAIARAHGARKVIAVDINEMRLGIAAELGAVTVKGERTPAGDAPARDRENVRIAAAVKELGGNDGPDVVLEMSGQPDALNNGISAARRGGKVILFGIPKHDEVAIRRYSSDVVFKGLTLHAVIGRRIYQTWEQVRELLRKEENRAMIRRVITDVMPFGNYEAGFTKMLAGKAGKVVLDFSGA
jgi:threonine 3-dehydrogenase